MVLDSAEVLYDDQYACLIVQAESTGLLNLTRGGCITFSTLGLCASSRVHCTLGAIGCLCHVDECYFKEAN